jgi:hypothetical protein
MNGRGRPYTVAEIFLADVRGAVPRSQRRPVCRPRRCVWWDVLWDSNLASLNRSTSAGVLTKFNVKASSTDLAEVRGACSKAKQAAAGQRCANTPHAHLLALLQCAVEAKPASLVLLSWLTSCRHDSLARLRRWRLFVPMCWRYLI